MRAGSQIYVSASIPDRPLAQQIVSLLQAAGYDVHWEESELRALSSKAQVAASRARCVLVIWSYTSVSSRWVLEEALEAQARNALVEIEIAPVDRPTEGDCISFEDWDGTIRAPEWRSLMEEVRAVVGRPQGELPVKEQLSPAVGVAVVAVAGAIAMTLGAQAPSPDLLALELPTDPTQPTSLAMGGPDDSIPAPASIAQPNPFTPPVIDIQWGEAPPPLAQASIDLVPALEVGVTTLAYNAQFESGEQVAFPNEGAITAQ